MESVRVLLLARPELRCCRGVPVRSRSPGACSLFDPRVAAARCAPGPGLAESSHPPPPVRATCCSPVRCVRRDLLWPPLLPGFSSLVEILRSSSAQHTHPLYTTGQAAHAHTRTHPHTTHSHTCTCRRGRTLARSIDRGSFKKA